jgi:hypothetical protein
MSVYDVALAAAPTGTAICPKAARNVVTNVLAEE